MEYWRGRYRPEVMIDERNEYSVYASECMLIPGYIEQSITLDLSTLEEGKRFLRYSIEFEVEPDRDQRGHIYRGYSQSHRLGETREGHAISFLKTLEALHGKTKRAIERKRHPLYEETKRAIGRKRHCLGKLKYISDVLEATLRNESLLVHQPRLKLLEKSSGRKTWQAQFIRRGASGTTEEDYERREVRRDRTLGRINKSRVARGFGIHVSNNEKRSRKREERMRYPSHSDAESTGSWETASSVGSYYGSSHGRRRRSSSRNHDGYRGYESLDDDYDTRSHVSSVFSKLGRSSSYGSSRSSVSSGSSRSDPEYGSRHRSYRTNYPRKQPMYQSDDNHGYESTSTEDTPWSHAQYPGAPAQYPYYPYYHTAGDAYR
ncbi:hypothetical protein BOTCAL_0058g00100 [Botryotinia calthae]|uniref:Uncharacterized protein n=1 Tax=Botryotinia calthae TaxID=38488 RepID=A0A4Y8DCI8_9HELO|nr:hypothetical protein BOTCAL_0058g00100 [Botryotinia calthae]